MRPRALDLFCGAGGASMGLHRAGFDVTGVDINDQPRYPFQFRIANALAYPLEGFDFIWASPPCQHYSCATFMWRKDFDRKGKKQSAREYPDLVADVRARLIASGVPWVIENVYGAPLINPIRLCGLNFGLGVLRHRYFEASFGMLAPSHIRHVKGCTTRGEMVSVFGGGGGGLRQYKLKDGTVRTWQRGNTAAWKKAMDIDWMDRATLAQAIPPAYSEFIGRQALQVLA
jgi:DNA (cytosine-5)-methyltransferase 1